MKATEEQIKKAVDWWSGAIKNPVFDMQGKEHRTVECDMTEAMGSVLSKSNPVNEAQQSVFGIELARLLRLEDGGSFIFINVDYGPCGILGEAVMAAGITGACVFPWKTRMWIRDDGTVDVSLGYRAELETL